MRVTPAGSPAGCELSGGHMTWGALMASPLRHEAIWYVYLLECVDGTLYCGIAKDPYKRLAQHNGALPGGPRYTAGRRPVHLLTSTICNSKSEALKLERKVKSRPRNEKLLFLESA